MHQDTPPAKVASNELLGQVQDRAAFECLVLQLTGRDMKYHARNGTTGIDHAWISYRAGVAAERERCAKLCDDSNIFDYQDPGGFFAKLIRGPGA